MNHYPGLITTGPDTPVAQRFYFEANMVGFTPLQVSFLEDWFGLDDREPGQDLRSNHNVWTVHNEESREAPEEDDGQDVETPFIPPPGTRLWKKGERFRLNEKEGEAFHRRVGTVIVDQKPNRWYVTVQLDDKKHRDQFGWASLEPLNGAPTEVRLWRKGDRFRLNKSWSKNHGRLGTVMVSQKPGAEMVTALLDGNKTRGKFGLGKLMRLDDLPSSNGPITVEPTEDGMRAVVQALRGLGDSCQADQLRKMVLDEFHHCGSTDRRCVCDRDE